MKTWRALVFSLVLSFGVLFSSFGTYAQCAVCKTNVASSIDSKTKKSGLGINSGIVTLLIMPYLVVGVVGVIWYKNGRRKVGNR